MIGDCGVTGKIGKGMALAPEGDPRVRFIV